MHSPHFHWLDPLPHNSHDSMHSPHFHWLDPLPHNSQTLTGVNRNQTQAPGEKPQVINYPGVELPGYDATQVRKSTTSTTATVTPTLTDALHN